MADREPLPVSFLLAFKQRIIVSLQNIRVVLVNTSHAGNIGGAARAMKNMGLSRLVLVDPEDFPSPNAVARASGATDILDGARVVATLEEALAGCSLVLGTSARDRRIPGRCSILGSARRFPWSSLPGAAKSHWYSVASTRG